MRVPPAAPLRHALLVAGGFSLVFAWLYSRAIFGGYLSESDLYEYYLPIFLSPITIWSSYEFSGLPAFADPGDFTPYPLHFLFARVIGSWTGLVLSAYVLAGAFTYAYVLRLTRSRTAAAFAGLGYALSEAMLERLPHLSTLHAFAWLPFIVLSIEAFRTGGSRRWIAAGAAGIACCILAGHPQPAVYVVYASGAYALAGGLADRAPRGYYAGVAAMFALGGLLAGIKVLPLAEASLHMARQAVSFGQFVSHANAPAEMLAAFFPDVAHDGREAPLYVGLLPLMLAVIAAVSARGGWRGWYWIAAALVALALGAGDATPIASIAYHLPLYDKFRVSPRHLFLAAYGAAVLAGLGVAALQQRRVSMPQALVAIGAVTAALAAGAAVLIAWPSLVRLEAPLAAALAGPAALALASAAAILVVVRHPKAAAVLCLVAAVDLVHAAPSAVDARGLKPVLLPRNATAASVHARTLASRLEPLRQRLLAAGGTHRDAVVPAAFARLWQIPIAGGYGPMLLERYNALAMMGTNGSVDPALLSPDNAALDLLAGRFVVFRTDDLAPAATFEAEGVTWSRPPLEWSIGRPDCGQTYSRRTTIALPPDLTIAGFTLVAHLRCSEDVPQGLEVLRLRVMDGPAAIHEQQLRAGVEIAERHLSDSAVRARARHTQPRPFGDPDLPAASYSIRVELPAPVRGASLEMSSPPFGGWATIDRLTLFADDGRHIPLGVPGAYLDGSPRWRKVASFRTSRMTDRGADEPAPGEDAYVVYENRRALPRAWITSDVVALAEIDAVPAVHHGWLPDGRRFDPTAMALVEPGTPEAGAFSTGTASARVTDIADGRITVDVATQGGGFLVLSESYYPGWRARIDGAPAAVRRANVSLQGVAVPPGQHTIVFEFVPATYYAGIALSAAALAGVLWLVARG